MDKVYIGLLGCMIFLCLLESWLETPKKRSDRHQRWPAHFALTLINFGIYAILPFSAIAMAEFGTAQGYGLFNHQGINIPAYIMLPLCWLLLSAVGYFLHVLMHKIPLLWRLHRVHHSDTLLDGSTAIRHHPAEEILSAIVHSGAVLALGLPSYAVAAAFIFEFAITIFTHTQFRFPPKLEKIIAMVFVTPQIHNIHHSAYHQETDSNYGGSLTIWDRIFGTLKADTIRSKDQFRFGLKEVSKEDACDLDKILLHPLKPVSTLSRKVPHKTESQS